MCIRDRKLGAENFEDQILNLPLESGNYRILTSNRLPNGNMFANEYHFEIQPGETKEIELVPVSYTHLAMTRSSILQNLICLVYMYLRMEHLTSQMQLDVYKRQR